MGWNLKLREKYKEITGKKWRHHFLASSIFPEHSQTRGQKLTFETNGKTLAPPLGAKFTKMGDSLPWMDAVQNLTPLYIIFGGEIRNRTDKQNYKQ